MISSRQLLIQSFGVSRRLGWSDNRGYGSPLFVDRPDPQGDEEPLASGRAVSLPARPV